MNVEQMTRDELAHELTKLLANEQHGKETERLLHELQVHQVELELQNRELRDTQQALEASRTRFEDLYDFAPVAYFTLDATGVVREVNLTGATMVGLERNRIIGTPFLSIVKMPSPEAFWSHLRRCVSERRAVVTEMRFTAHGETRDVQVASVPVLDPAGLPLAFRTSFTDISQRKQAEAELARARDDEARLRKRFEDLDHASLAINHVLASAAVVRTEELMQLLVEEARRIADAEFAAFGIAHDPDRAFDPWVHAGMASERASALGRAPRPRGLLGEVARTGATVRLRDLREHAAFAGFPRAHPEMRSFLGVPVRVGDQAAGYLYLTNKRFAEEFGEDDQRVIEMFAERAGLALELARLNGDLARALAARDNLLAVVSHDLRSPLQAVRLSAQILDTIPDLDRPTYLRQLEIIVRSTDRMNRLIDDLLDAGTIEAGSFTAQLAREEVAPIVDVCISAAAALAARKSIRIERELAAALPPIQCDRMRIVQVLSNLIGNAIKFVPEGGLIRIRASAHGDEVQFAVSDDGPGIAADELPHLFDRYWRGKAQGGHGFGLGLYISKGIVEAHRGRLWVESRVGVGTTFYFTTPIASEADAQS